MTAPLTPTAGAAAARLWRSPAAARRWRISECRGLLGDLRAGAWSASSLELWIACPARWLIERTLRSIRPEPEPEPLGRGRLAHAALRDTLAGLRQRTGSARLTPERLDLARLLLRAALARHEHDVALSAKPERVPGARRRLRADLERYLALAAAQNSPLEPVHLELGFGFEGEPDSLPALQIGEGVRLRGRIDRIDIGSSGEAVVYDYKGANVSRAARWIADGKIQLAVYMRAAEKLLGLRVLGGFYQPLTGGDLRARGALDASAEAKLQCVRGDRLDRAELQALLDEAIVLARQAAAQAIAGEIEARPWTCSYAGKCSYPAICRCGG